MAEWSEEDSRRYSRIEKDELTKWHGRFFEAVVQSGVADGAKSILSIGAGTGSVESLLAQYTHAEMGWVEPSAEFESILTETLPKAVETFQGRFEDYSSDRRYDLVISLHSWYFLGLNPVLLEKALSCLAARGRLFILLAKSRCFQQRLYEAVRGEKYPYLGIDELRDWSQQEGYQAHYCEYPVGVPLEEYVSDGKFTRSGRRLVEVLGVVDWSHLNDHAQVAALRELQLSADSDLKLEFGYLIFTRSSAP